MAKIAANGEKTTLISSPLTQPIPNIFSEIEKILAQLEQKNSLVALSHYLKKLIFIIMKLPLIFVSFPLVIITTPCAIAKKVIGTEEIYNLAYIKANHFVITRSHRASWQSII